MESYLCMYGCIFYVLTHEGSSSNGASNHQATPQPPPPGQADEGSGPDTTSLWYDVETLEAVKGAGEHRPVEAPIDKIPVFQRGGSIIPR